MNNYTSYNNLELIKKNLIDIFAEHLRWSIDLIDVSYDDKIKKLEKFIKDIAPIKNLQILTKIRKRYELK